MKVIVMGLLISMPVLSWAQEWKVSPGDTIRVTYTDIVTSRITGELQNISVDSLYLTQEASTVSLALSSVKGIDISVGRRTWAGRGAAVGAISGGLLIGTYALASDKNCSPDDPWCMDLFSPGESFATGFILGAAGGAFTGLVIGGLTETHRWEKVPFEVVVDTISFRLAKSHNNYGLTVRLRY